MDVRYILLFLFCVAVTPQDAAGCRNYTDAERRNGVKVKLSFRDGSSDIKQGDHATPYISMTNEGPVAHGLEIEVKLKGGLTPWLQVIREKPQYNDEAAAWKDNVLKIPPQANVECDGGEYRLFFGFYGSKVGSASFDLTISYRVDGVADPIVMTIDTPTITVRKREHTKPALCSDNLISNPSFEEPKGIKGWWSYWTSSTGPTGWSWGNGQSPTIWWKGYAETDPVDGDQTVELNVQRNIFQDFEAPPESQLSYYVRHSKYYGSPEAKVSLKSHGDVLTQHDIVPSNSWGTVYSTFRVPKGITKINLVLESVKSGIIGGTRFDDVHVAATKFRVNFKFNTESGETQVGDYITPELEILNEGSAVWKTKVTITSTDPFRFPGAGEVLEPTGKSIALAADGGGYEVDDLMLDCSHTKASMWFAMMPEKAGTFTYKVKIESYHKGMPNATLSEFTSPPIVVNSRSAPNVNTTTSTTATTATTTTSTTATTTTTTTSTTTTTTTTTTNTTTTTTTTTTNTTTTTTTTTSTTTTMTTTSTTTTMTTTSTTTTMTTTSTATTMTTTSTATTMTTTSTTTTMTMTSTTTTMTMTSTTTTMTTTSTTTTTTSTTTTTTTSTTTTTKSAFKETEPVHSTTRGFLASTGETIIDGNDDELDVVDQKPAGKPCAGLIVVNASITVEVNAQRDRRLR